MTYLYLCPIHGEFELEHSIKEQIENCPKCIEENLEPQKLTRLIQKTYFILQGGGWSKDNYK